MLLLSSTLIHKTLITYAFNYVQKTEQKVNKPCENGIIAKDMNNNASRGTT